MPELLFRIVQALFATGIGTVSILSIVRALATGEAEGRYLSVRRRQHPFFYWLALLLKAGLVVLCGCAIIQAWLGHRLV